MIETFLILLYSLWGDSGAKLDPEYVRERAEAATEEERELARRGKRVEAIASYRKRTGASLREAAAVEYLLRKSEPVD